MQFTSQKFRSPRETTVVLTKQKIERWYRICTGQGQLYVYGEGMHVSGNGWRSTSDLLARVARRDRWNPYENPEQKEGKAIWGWGSVKRDIYALYYGDLGTASQQAR